MRRDGHIAPSEARRCQRGNSSRPSKNVSARGNIAHIFGPGGGQMLHPDEWPEEVASAVKNFKVSATGVSVSRYDAAQACREVIETLGTAKGTGTGLSELAAALWEDLARHDTPPHLGIPMSG